MQKSWYKNIPTLWKLHVWVWLKIGSGLLKKYTLMVGLFMIFLKNRKLEGFVVLRGLLRRFILNSKMDGKKLWTAVLVNLQVKFLNGLVMVNFHALSKSLLKA